MPLMAVIGGRGGCERIGEEIGYVRAEGGCQRYEAHFECVCVSVCVCGREEKELRLDEA